MTSKQILKKAIEKAVKNGLDMDNHCRNVKNVIEANIYYELIFSHDFAKAFVLYLLKEKAKFISERVSHEYEEYETRLQIGDEVLHPFDGFYFEDEPEDMTIEKLLKKDSLIEDLKDWFLENLVLEKEPLKYLEKFL